MALLNVVLAELKPLLLNELSSVDSTVVALPVAHSVVTAACPGATSAHSRRPSISSFFIGTSLLRIPQRQGDVAHRDHRTRAPQHFGTGALAFRERNQVAARGTRVGKNAGAGPRAT